MVHNDVVQISFIYLRDCYPIYVINKVHGPDIGSTCIQ